MFKSSLLGARTLKAGSFCPSVVGKRPVHPKWPDAVGPGAVAVAVAVCVFVLICVYVIVFVFTLLSFLFTSLPRSSECSAV